MDTKPLQQRLRQNAEHHRDIATQCDCRPEDTLNWQHALDDDEAADALAKLEEERDAALKLAADRLEQMQADRKQALGWRDELKACREAEPMAWLVRGLTPGDLDQAYFLEETARYWAAALGKTVIPIYAAASQQDGETSK